MINYELGITKVQLGPPTGGRNYVSHINRMTSERSHVYRKMMKIKGSTPAGVVCFAEADCF
jgi:hypothetical protein